MGIDKKGEGGINNSDISPLTLQQATQNRDNAKNALLEFEKDNPRLKKALEKEEVNQKIKAINDFFTSWKKLPHSKNVDELWLTIDAKNIAPGEHSSSVYSVKVRQLTSMPKIMRSQLNLQQKLAQEKIETEDKEAYNFLRTNMEVLINNVHAVRVYCSAHEIEIKSQQGALSKNKTVGEMLAQLGPESKEYPEQQFINLEAGTLQNYYRLKAQSDAAEAQFNQFGKK